MRTSGREATLVSRPSLSALLSWALVAFVIELDNECEHVMPHRTTIGGPANGGGVWLTSATMYFNCMRFVDRDGISIAELARKARTRTNIDGMRRWGYISLDGDVVRATPRGEAARQLWAAQLPLVETRWQERFGEVSLGQLRSALGQIVAASDVDLPDCLPILGYGLQTNMLPGTSPPPTMPRPSQPLPVLIAQPLLAFALEFERESPVSLAIGANIFRLIDGSTASVRDLPQQSGVSKEAVAMALSFLQRTKLAAVVSRPGVSRFKTVELTVAGNRAKATYEELLSAVDDAFVKRFGSDKIRALRGALQPIVGDGSAHSSPLFRGLQPYPDNWRATVPKPQTLPHFPMVLHRGGYPDGC